MSNKKELEGTCVRLFKEDLEKLRELSESRGDIIFHIRKAVHDYVEKMEG